MSLVLAYDQTNASTLSTGVANLPAGATLLKAKLSCYTWFSSVISPPQIQGAPPNTLLGIAYVPHGTPIPLVTATNWKDTATWVIAGPGRLLTMDRWADSTPADSTRTFVQHTYSNEIEINFAFFNAAAFDLGISLNFLGGGFWSTPVPWLSYQFEAYFD